MNRYRNTTTVEIRTEDELTTSPAEEIEGLDEEDYLSPDVKLRGDAAIREYFIECLNEVVEIRNDLMHFTTDDADPAQYDAVEGLLEMLRTADPRQ